MCISRGEFRVKGFPSVTSTYRSAGKVLSSLYSSYDQLHLPRRSGAAEAVEPGSGWPCQLLRAVVGALQGFPDRMVSAIHPGEGADRHWIRPVGQSLEPNNFY